MFTSDVVLLNTRLCPNNLLVAIEGKSIEGTIVGSVMMKMSNGSSIQLNNCITHPMIRCNLLSLEQFEDLDASTMVKSGVLTVFNSSNESIFSFSRLDGLYQAAVEIGGPLSDPSFVNRPNDLNCIASAYMMQEVFVLPESSYYTTGDYANQLLSKSRSNGEMSIAQGQVTVDRNEALLDATRSAAVKDMGLIGISRDRFTRSNTRV